MHLNFSGWVANRMDPDQTPRSLTSDLGLYCSLRPACPNTQVIYNILYITKLIKESHCNRIWLMTRHISVYAFRTVKAVSSLYKKRCRWRVENKCLDQTVRTDRLIWICFVRISYKGLFSHVMVIFRRPRQARKFLNMRKIRRHRSSCACAKYHPGL